MKSIGRNYMHMNILLWIIFGGLAGWIASLLTGDDAAFGLVGNILLGIVGAVVGGWIADALGIGGEPGADRPTSFVSFLVAVAGAVLVLAIINLIF